jgi:hypothetical protein
MILIIESGNSGFMFQLPAWTGSVFVYNPAPGWLSHVAFIDLV